MKSKGTYILLGFLSSQILAPLIVKKNHERGQISVPLLRKSPICILCFQKPY